MSTSKEARDEFIASGSEIEKDLLKIFKKEDPIVIADIGACDGLSSIIYSKIFPKSFIHAFEPIEENFKEMCDNFIEYGLEGRFKARLTALGDAMGIADMYRSYGQAEWVKKGWDTGNKSSSLLKPKIHLQIHQWCKFKKETTMINTLDSYKLRIDFAHIDVQGAEDKVLKGGKQTFKAAKAIWVEVACTELYAGQPLKNDILRIVDPMGFKVVKDTCGSKHAGDLLLVRK